MDTISTTRQQCWQIQQFLKEFKRRLNEASNDNSGEKEEQDQERQQWSHRFIFFLILVGNAFNLGQIWRFPQLAYNNGRGTFLICYGISLLTFGYSVHLLEVLLGQYTSRSAVLALGIVPAGTGVGIASVFNGFFFVVYTNQIVAYSLYYLFYSFRDPLPWSVCRKATHPDIITCSSDCNSTDLCSSPYRYYWEHIVNEQYREEDSNFGGIGPPLLGLAFSSAVAWTIIAISGLNGLKSVEKVTKITALFPYILLQVLFVMSLKVDSGWHDLAEFFHADLIYFGKPETWTIAFEEALYSLSVGKAFNLITSSHANFKSASHIDSFVVCLATLFTSILCGVLVFSMLGAIKGPQEEFKDFIADGPGLIFIVFMEALALLPNPVFCSIVFFLMIAFIGISTVVSAMNCYTTSFLDVFPKFHRHRKTVSFFLVFLAFLLGLPVMCRGGLTYFDVLDQFIAFHTLLPICALKLLLVSYCYGLGRFCEDVQFMLDWYPNRFLRYTWGLGGFLLLALAGFCSYENVSHSFKFWWNVVGCTASSIILVPIPIVLVVQVVKFAKTKRLKNCFRPNPNYGPANLKVKIARKEFKIKRQIF